MANEVLKEFFQEMHLKIATSVNPNSIIDLLFSKKVVSSDDYHRLREVPVIRERCRDLLSLLHASSHPRTFIHLRLALLDEYSWIVEEIDKKLPSLTSQLQQLHLDNSSDGNFCYNLINQCKSQDRPHCLSRHFPSSLFFFICSSPPENPAKGCEKRCKLAQRGLEHSYGRKRILAAFKLRKHV